MLVHAPWNRHLFHPLPVALSRHHTCVMSSWPQRHTRHVHAGHVAWSRQQRVQEIQVVWPKPSKNRWKQATKMCQMAESTGWNTQKQWFQGIHIMVMKYQNSVILHHQIPTKTRQAVYWYSKWTIFFLYPHCNLTTTPFCVWCRFNPHPGPPCISGPSIFGRVVDPCGSTSHLNTGEQIRQRIFRRSRI